MSQQHWKVILPAGERAVSVATGLGWAAAVTSTNFLRTFTSGGAQANVIWLKGDVVTCAGRGNFLGVVYHGGECGMDGTQNLNYSVYDVLADCEIATGKLSAIR